MARGRRLIWVRSPRAVDTVTGLVVDTTNVDSLRSQSAYIIGPLTGHSLDQAFTIKRLLIWAQLVTRVASDATVLPTGYVGARVGNSREFVEFGTDPAFLAANAPTTDQDADWMAWSPVFASAVSQGAADDTYVGKAFWDIRSQRRVDEAGEDIFIFKEISNTAAGQVTTLAVSWAALCHVD